MLGFIGEINGGISFKKNILTALAGMGQCLERRPAHQRVLSSIPGQGHVPKLQIQFPPPIGVNVGRTN